MVDHPSFVCKNMERNVLEVLKFPVKSQVKYIGILDFKGVIHCTCSDFNTKYLLANCRDSKYGNWII